ncbi:MAG: leucyl aminopeptidase [Nocardioides sp.]|uniref:leucyl aminopeptidase n=1 Tax=Nocardioides sp. TaxID=35761 RepID=UPI003F0FF17F
MWALPVLPGASAEDPVLLGPGADEASQALDVDLLAAAEALGATGKVGEVLLVPVSGRADLVLLVGVGEADATSLRRAGAALARATKDRDAVVTTLAALGDEDGLEAFVVGTVLGSFEFHWRSQGPKARPVGRVVLADVGGDQDDESYDAALARGLAVGRAAWRSRALATVPSNLKNPEWMAEQARQLADEAGLEVRVWDEAQLAEEGFGGILAVGAASATPPRLVRLDYAPAGATASTPTVALVGKGITFDTGGLDIKPPDSMLTMKRDMSGSAAVLATMGALAEVGCPVRVVGLLPLAENAVSGSAMRPGDVITHFGGRTSEVNNTDAEGRLVLADAMAYAVAEVDPDVLVDVATLTGAMKVALGLHTAGYFATDDALATQVERAARASGENVWRMPLAAEYQERTASKIADVDNAAGGPGAITAALFLQPFAGGKPWVHVDFASVAEAVADRHELTAGPTGFGARLLLSWLGSETPLEGVK